MARETVRVSSSETDASGSEVDFRGAGDLFGFGLEGGGGVNNSRSHPITRDSFNSTTFI